jgi:hypothetical protein
VSVQQLAEQGPVKSTIDYHADKADMAIDLNGKLFNKSLPLDGLCISDGAGTDMLLARFPLSAGYSTSFYIADAQTQKLKKMILKVTGNETIRGINTTVVSFVNDENENENATYYIDLDKKMAVKTVQIIPAMMNAKLTMELQ